MTAGTRTWTGTWVADRLDVRLRTTVSPVGLALDDLVGLAVRRNPRRAHLLVSRVLAKHVPTDPRLVRGAALLLGALVREVLDDDFSLGDDAARTHLGRLVRRALDDEPGAAVALRDTVVAATGGGGVDAAVLGYAETATALGHDVAVALGRADYLHSTRRPVPGVDVLGAFEESHSHATSHLLLPADPALVTRDRPLVLVDDELSTGSTVLNTISALHEVSPRRRYVVATLVDLRSEEDGQRLVTAVAALGAHVDVVSLVRGTVDLPPDALRRGADLVAEVASGGKPSAATASSGRVHRIDVGWPPGLPEGGRHGVGPEVHRAWSATVPEVAARLDAGGPPVAAGSRVLVLGTEELMAAPLHLAEAWADARPDLDVRFSTTTRSPAVAVDDEGYALRSVVRFAAHDEPDGDRFAYNVSGRGREVRPGPRRHRRPRGHLRAGVTRRARRRPRHRHPGGRAGRAPRHRTVVPPVRARASRSPCTVRRSARTPPMR